MGIFVNIKPLSIIGMDLSYSFVYVGSNKS
jgi:hypothetical protein